MEILDVVDEKDNVVESLPKNVVYENKLIHRIVHILVFNDLGKIALQMQGHRKKFCPLHWSTTAGGHVQTGETYEQAAEREFFEEVGKKVEIHLLYKDIYTYPNGLKKFLATFRANYNGPFSPNPIEVEKVEFFSLNEIRQMINEGEKFHPELLFLLKKHYNL